jgi:hypothetical protein
MCNSCFTTSSKLLYISWEEAENGNGSISLKTSLSVTNRIPLIFGKCLISAIDVKCLHWDILSSLISVIYLSRIPRLWAFL